MFSTFLGLPFIYSFVFSPLFVLSLGLSTCQRLRLHTERFAGHLRAFRHWAILMSVQSLHWTGRNYEKDLMNWSFPSVRPIIRMGRLFSNDYLDIFFSNRFSAFCLVFSANFLFPLTNIIFAFKTFLLQILGSEFNLADLSRTSCVTLIVITIR